MTDAVVSVITPAYNAARFLPDCLASVAAQTYPHWEHIVVDDGSTDTTATILAAAAAAEPRLRPVILPANAGAYVARNAALAAAGGRYIAFLDADDLWLPAKLERQLAFMQSGGHAMSYHWYRTIDEDGVLLGRGPIWMPPQLDFRRYLALNGTMGNLTVMIDRNRTGSFEMPDMGAEDFALYLSLLRRHSAHGLFEDLARHRVVAGSLSSNKATAMRWVWQVYRSQPDLGLPAATWYMGRYVSRGVLKNVVHKRLRHR